MKKRILIVAGEPSGDLHASNLVINLKSLQSDFEFFGMGGSLMEKAGVKIEHDITAMALVGLAEVLKRIVTVGKAFRGILNKVDCGKTDLAILVDYPGFNLRLAKELKKRDIPVVYYISPQVWAWGRNRVNIIKRCVRKILVFFKFEEELYRTYGIDAQFVGHPLVDTVKVTISKEDFLKKHSLDAGKRLIALLPGSRAIEVQSLLPIMASAADLLAERLKNVRFAVAKHPGLPLSLYKEALGAKRDRIRVVEADVYNLLNASDFAIVTSGTATLETAMVGTPLVIIYKASLLTYLVYHFVATTDFLGLVNIIAGKEVSPELLQYDATAEKIADKVTELVSDDKKLSKMREELKRVASSLGDGGASLRAARSILPLLS